MTVTDPAPRYRGRFAPSPTGRLHFGSLVAALGSWLLARHHDGEWLVRVEDLDPPREVPGAAEAQLATLAAFGMTSDLPVVWQSRRHDLYAEALGQLLADGAAFECRCSRTDLTAVGGIHRACVARDPARPAAFRLRVADDSRVAFVDGLQGPVEQAVDREVGDVVLRRADGFWAYQLAVVVDDADQGITDVVRGADLLDSTPRQILLQRALGLTTPHYLHLPLIVDAEGQKLSKSMAALPVDDDAPVPALRAAWRVLGQPEAVLADAASTLGALTAAQRHFRPTSLPKVTHMTFAAAHNKPVAGAV
ncbi:MAG: tRNA glutamyl-Q(34) synthetase GluQRS [Pseudoxanthomonas sp.]